MSLRYYLFRKYATERILDDPARAGRRPAPPSGHTQPVARPSAEVAAPTRGVSHEAQVEVRRRRGLGVLAGLDAKHDPLHLRFVAGGAGREHGDAIAVQPERFIG